MKGHRLACWRFRVWDRRLAARRVRWNRLDQQFIATRGYGDYSEVLEAEAAVDVALAKRNQWRNRACQKCRTRVLRSLS